MWTANDSNSIFQRLNCLHFIKKILTISFCCHLSLSHVRSFAIPWTQNTRLICPPLSSGVCSNSCLLSWWCYLTISSSAAPFSFNLSQHQGLFQWVSLCIRGPKYWSLSFSVSPSNEYSGLISFRIDWFDLHTVQGTLKSLLTMHIAPEKFGESMKTT